MSLESSHTQGPKSSQNWLNKTVGHRSLWLGTMQTDFMPCEMSRDQAQEAMLPQEGEDRPPGGRGRDRRAPQTPQPVNHSQGKGREDSASATQESLSFKQEGAEPLPNGDGALGAHRTEPSY